MSNNGLAAFLRRLVPVVDSISVYMYIVKTSTVDTKAVFICKTSNMRRMFRFILLFYI